MPATKQECTRYKSILTASGLSGKTVTDVIVTQHGIVTAIEIVYSGGSQFIKEKQGLVEVGGTLEWNTGTQAF
jgi:hypothetical protein